MRDCFFFQAEDGIRGLTVTGVQTCALPIFSSNPKTFIVAFLTFWYIALSDKGASPALDFADWFGKTTPAVTAARSEERRVGQESRPRRWPSGEKERRGTPRQTRSGSAPRTA